MRLVLLPERAKHGAFGRVYRARATQDPTKVLTVKEMHVTDHVQHPRLLHEACALVVPQSHKSLPLVYAWGYSQFYEYIDDAEFSASRAAAHGLEHIHCRGIVYCDIEPGNLMLGSDTSEPGRVRFIDFASTGICITRHRVETTWRLALVVSRLPWESQLQWRLSSRCSFDLKKQWSGERLEGELSLLGEFVDYATSLAYSEQLDSDYACWRGRFGALIPDLPDDPLYEPSDRSGPPLVGNFDLPQVASSI